MNDVITKEELEEFKRLGEKIYKRADRIDSKFHIHGKHQEFYGICYNNNSLGAIMEYEDILTETTDIILLNLEEDILTNPEWETKEKEKLQKEEETYKLLRLEEEKRIEKEERETLEKLKQKYEGGF